MMGEVSENLKLAKALIVHESFWTQGRLARDKQGIPVMPRSKEACQWCSVGACQKVSVGCAGWPSALSLLNFASLELYNLHIEPANDIRTHADVMKIFDLAIQYSEEENV